MRSGAIQRTVRGSSSAHTPTCPTSSSPMPAGSQFALRTEQTGGVQRCTPTVEHAEGQARRVAVPHGDPATDGRSLEVQIDADLVHRCSFRAGARDVLTQGRSPHAVASGAPDPRRTGRLGRRLHGLDPRRPRVVRSGAPHARIDTRDVPAHRDTADGDVQGEQTGKADLAYTTSHHAGLPATRWARSCLTRVCPRGESTAIVTSRSRFPRRCTSMLTPSGVARGLQAHRGEFALLQPPPQHQAVLVHSGHASIHDQRLMHPHSLPGSGTDPFAFSSALDPP